VIQGHLNRHGNKYVITPDHGSAFEVPVKDLSGIELGSPATPATATKRAFSALQYQIGRQKNLDASRVEPCAFCALTERSAGSPLLVSRHIIALEASQLSA
jgi:hypothetical protein